MDIACVFGRAMMRRQEAANRPIFGRALARFAVAALRSRCAEAHPVAHLSSRAKSGDSIDYTIWRGLGTIAGGETISGQY